MTNDELFDQRLAEHVARLDMDRVYWDDGKLVPDCYPVLRTSLSGQDALLSLAIGRRQRFLSFEGRQPTSNRNGNEFKRPIYPEALGNAST